MKIVHACEKTIPIECDLRNARVDFSEMTATVVAVATDQFRDGRRVVGYAFNSFGRYACGGPLRERFIPRLLAAPPSDLLDPDTQRLDPPRVATALLRREKAGAHAERSMAVGTLELALWDAAAKLEGRPLYQALASRYGVAGAGRPRAIACYAGGGFYKPTDDRARLRDEIQGYLDAGYRDVKIKAGGLPLAQDLARIESALALLHDGSHLALDASCAFGRDSALAYARAVAPYGLRWLEEPCDPADFDTYRAVSEQYPGMLAGGENLYSKEEAENFLRYGPAPHRVVLQPDPPLAYGIGEFHRMVRLAGRHGVPAAHIMPHGGNLMSLHVAAGLGLGGAESYPGLFGAFGGFGREVAIADGHASLPAAPGIGFEEQPELYRIFAALPANP
ncbi:mandelate racemase/muconate lactonizing protein [Achromobacter xylosoxidans C54]|uniref:enolase C-terminal domain-like protein n=1 Tax=Alcaligenes xylosoxydans xylosoxydans TaxID=85698 RepID=UPI0001F43B4C|nr:enolase C-terminal domain-like protein [Achromobacter xylosoxidans]EFV85720.1 mandelate racemase/muconate lactonizing protein [Achromobacter xylosoxidans C54]